ncbi:MAG: BamA/TamA family outer membrane protein [Chitinophagaceae bacterium]|nr:BamA/TamA family outer membrane protein [Chitinophagaceae bacterium]
MALLSFLFITSCTEPRHYQHNKPFIFKSDVTLHSDLKKNARQQLREGLMNQMDDSLKVRTVLAVRIRPPFFYYRLSAPPVFDSSYIGRSKTFMTALLHSQGYFQPVITDTFRIDTIRKGRAGGQQRVYLKFLVTPGKSLKMDSVGYDLKTPELQLLALENREKSLLKKNAPYSIPDISKELDRLLNLYRDNGFYKLSKEDLYAEHDTVVAALIDPNLDPFEQLELLDSLQKRKKEPTITIVIKQRAPKDSTHLMKYSWGNINVYPDKTILADSTAAATDTAKIDGYTLYHTTNKFKLPFIARNIFAKPGTLYRQSDYFNTINKFTNLGAWQQVDVNVNERNDSSKKLDANVLLYPAKKQSMNVDFEASRNETDVLTTGSLLGIALNFGIRNKNAFRESIATSSNARFGVELGPNIIQTLQASLSHSIFVPRFITPFKIKSEKNVTAPRTIINLNTSYTDRRKFYSTRSINASWGYDWSKHNHSWQYVPFNFEYTWTPVKTDSFITLEEGFPSLKQAFNDGLIIGQILGYTTGKSIGNTQSFFRAKLEESGALFGLIKNLERGELRRFVKLDLEYKYFINYPRATWAFRAYGGYGYVYGKTGDTTSEYNLPFFKAYFAGGPYTMRAWQVRRLGPGSSTVFDRAKKPIDRFGDMKLEGNIEYRFDIGTIAGIKVKSALFTDIGNIWGKTYDADMKPLDSTEFNLSRLYTDLGVGAGTSLRFDFDFFMIRLDWAYKIKNPEYAKENDGWFRGIKLNSGQFQLGIGVPF